MALLTVLLTTSISQTASSMAIAHARTRDICALYTRNNYPNACRNRKGHRRKLSCCVNLLISTPDCPGHSTPVRVRTGKALDAYSLHMGSLEVGAVGHSIVDDPRHSIVGNKSEIEIPEITPKKMSDAAVAAVDAAPPTVEVVAAAEVS